MPSSEEIYNKMKLLANIYFENRFPHTISRLHILLFSHCVLGRKNRF